jgi:hypothetical protein
MAIPTSIEREEGYLTFNERFSGLGTLRNGGGS